AREALPAAKTKVQLGLQAAITSSAGKIRTRIEQLRREVDTVADARDAVLEQLDASTDDMLAPTHELADKLRAIRDDADWQASIDGMESNLSGFMTQTRDTLTVTVESFEGDDLAQFLDHVDDAVRGTFDALAGQIAAQVDTAFESMQQMSAAWLAVIEQ